MKKLIIFCWLITVMPASVLMAQPFLSETTVATLGSLSNMHDCIVNCDMLEIPGPNPDNPQGTLKAIVWDNGERYNTTGSTAESWLYVEDANGNMQTISLGANTKQPDVVIANIIEPGDGTLPDYIVAVVYMEEIQGVSPNLYKYGLCSLTTVGVYNVGTIGFYIAPIWTGALGNASSYMVHGTEDANPHIDMWTDANTTVNGLPGLREFAVTWSEGYNYLNCLIPPAMSAYTGTPGRLYYTYGDVNTPWTAISNQNGSSIDCNGMNDVACYYDQDQMDQQVVITYGGAVPCTGRYGLYYLEMSKTAGSFPSGTLIDARPPAITRVEAMSQYDPTVGYLKWLIAASMPAGSPTPAPWEVLGYDNLSNTYALSGNYVGVDVKSPAVSGGVSPQLNGNIGNLQFNTGYYPRDYNNPGLYDHIWSTGVDAVTIPSMTSELQVDNNSVNYDWDVNRIYAVSTSSNSGFNILSAYYDGGDILYKESPNSFVYKPGTTGVQGVSKGKAVKLYPNPAGNQLFISPAENGSYEIINMTGIIVSKGMNTIAGINTTNLPQGVYTVKVKDEKNAVTSLKFVKK